MSRILVAEEGREVPPMLLAELQRAGHEVEPMVDGAAALHRILSAPPELSLLGIDLPRIDGLQILEKTRTRSDHPIIMLTARGLEADRLRGLELGADDYVCKPFSPREVVARIHTVLRRRRQRLQSVGPAPQILLGDVPGTVVLEGRMLSLTRRESLLLQVLAREPGRVFPRSELLESAFPEALEANERTVDVHIKNLRRKLAAISATRHRIRSIYGVGFVWDAPLDPGH